MPFFFFEFWKLIFILQNITLLWRVYRLPKFVMNCRVTTTVYLLSTLSTCPFTKIKTEDIRWFHFFLDKINISSSKRSFRWFCLGLNPIPVTIFKIVGYVVILFFLNLFSTLKFKLFNRRDFVNGQLSWILRVTL